LTGGYTEKIDIKFNKMHFLQSQIWKECKRNLGNEIFDVGQYFFHTTKLPILPRTIGYMPRPNLRAINWDNLIQKGLDAKAIFITIDPENFKSEIVDSVDYVNKKLQSLKTQNPKVKLAALPGNPVHLQENILLDLSKPSEELLTSMKQKHRYNLKLAAKKGVEVDITDTDKALEEFLQLYQQTIDRHEYNGRSAEYIYKVWKTYKEMAVQGTNNKADIQIATAYFENKPLASWMLFIYEDTIYYPYGGSSDESKNVMAPYALAWAITEWGKAKGYKWFDLWGIKKNKEFSTDGVSEELEYDGYSRFKVGFGGEHFVHANTVDVVLDAILYKGLKLLRR